MARWNGEDYKMYRVTLAVTLDFVVPPGCAADMRAEYAEEKAYEFMAEHAPEVDYAVAEVENVTPEFAR